MPINAEIMSKKRCLAPFVFRNVHRVVLAALLLCFCFPLYFLPLCVVVLVFIGSPRLLGRRSFARLMSDFTPEYNDMAHDQKVDHFASLKDVVSADPELRKVGKFRLLELGAGGGANFQYYPDNCTLIGTDDNPAMEPHFRASLGRRRPPLELEAFHILSATDMKAIPSESVDVIVTTMVLSYFSDYDSFFSEVDRVLAPGGRYYFWEHVQDPNPRSAQHAFQKFLEPFIVRTCDGGRVTKRIWEEFEKRRNTFGHLEWRHFTLEPYLHTSVLGAFMVWFLQGSNIRGVATKKL